VFIVRKKYNTIIKYLFLSLFIIIMVNVYLILWNLMHGIWHKDILFYYKTKPVASRDGVGESGNWGIF
jgi:hypothetical protein